MSQRRIAVLMGIIGILVSTGLVARLLSEFDWDPSTTIKFGVADSVQVEYGRRLLGADIVVAPGDGHDGKYFFMQAMDPFYLDPDSNAVYLDRPSYRAQRMAYPMLASVGGVLSPSATAWGLIVVNVIFMGLGTAVTALVALEMGLSKWFGMAFLLNPGVIVALNIDAAGVVATAALMAGVLAVLKERDWAAVAALTFAALARETMLLGVIGLAVYLIWKRRRIPWRFSLPFLVVGGWWLYVHQRLGGGLSQDTEALSLPFQGYWEALRIWTSTPGRIMDLLIGFVLLIASIAVTIRALRTPTPLGAAAAPFAVLALVLSWPVWLHYFDSARALAPVLTAYVIMVPAVSASADKSASANRRHEEVDTLTPT